MAKATITKSRRLQDLAVLWAEAGIIEFERIQMTGREAFVWEHLSQGLLVEDLPKRFCGAGRGWTVPVVDSLLRKVALDVVCQMEGGGAQGYAEALRLAGRVAAVRATRGPVRF